MFPPIISVPLTVFSAIVSARVLVDSFQHQTQPAARPATRQSQTEKYVLKNDPMCGLPAGGTFCDLDCVRFKNVYEDPACLRDCILPDCFRLLMEDHATHNGVCSGSVGHTENNWPNSDTGCQIDGSKVLDGLCRNETVQALIQQRCINELYSLPYHLRNSVRSIIRSMCRYEVYDYFFPLSCGLDCVRAMTDEGWVVTLTEDSSCISDCGCTEHLTADHLNAEGVCAGSYADVVLGWPVSTVTCQMDGTNVVEGLCRDETVKALIQQREVKKKWN